MRTVKTTVYVNGMTCGKCKAKIEKKLHSLDSVINVKVRLEGRQQPLLNMIVTA